MPHYYDKEQEGPLRPFKIPVKARHQSLELWSAAGVFSKDELDEGTKLLINQATVEPGWRVHDLGCGYGAVAVVIKKAVPSCEIVASDVSERAVELTKMNAKELKLDIKALQSDAYENVEMMFETVLVNPPYVAGRETIYRLIDQSFEHLNDGGILQLVARHAKGGETLKKRMIEVFDNCDDSAKSKGFRLYKSKKTVRSS